MRPIAGVTDQIICKSILEAGFSTADKITQNLRA